MSESLDSILSNDEAPEETADETSAVETEAKATSETPEADPAATESETDEIDAADDDLGDLRYSGLKKAAKKERKFRQAAEKQAKDLQRQIDQLTAQMQVQRQQPPPPQAAQPTEAKKEAEPDFFADPEGFATRKAEAAAQKVRDELSKRFEQQAASERQRYLNASERALCARDPEARGHIDHFVSLVNERDMRGQLTQHAQYALAQFNAVVAGQNPEYADPAEFAAEYAKAALRARQFSAPDYEAQLRAKWEAEQRGETEDAPVAPAKTHHKTIAGVRGASSRRAGSDPDSLKEILA